MAGDEHILVVRVRKAKRIAVFWQRPAVCPVLLLILLQCKRTDRIPVTVEQEKLGAGLADKVCEEGFAVVPCRRPQAGDKLLCPLIETALCKLLIRIGEEKPDTAVGGQNDRQRQDEKQEKSLCGQFMHQFAHQVSFSACNRHRGPSRCSLPRPVSGGYFSCVCPRCAYRRSKSRSPTAFRPVSFW